MKKRFLSILLTLCMVTQLMPTAALAAQVEAASNALVSSDVVTATDQGADQTAAEAQGDLANDEAQALDEQDGEASPIDDVDQDDAETSVAPQANDAAVTAVTETGDSAAEPALTSTAAHTHRTCGKADCADSAHEEANWVAWDKADSLPSEEPGATYYYLTQDVTLSSTWYVNSGYAVHLCLNGHTITGPNGDSAITIAGGRLAITDCHTGDAVGKITHKSGETGNGVSVNAGTFTMWNGSITGNTAGFGAGVANYAVFNMYGGSITGNRVNDKAVFDGFGGGVYNCARLQIAGDVTITGNVGKDGGADNVYMCKRSRIRVEDTGVSTGAKVGVKSEDPTSNLTLVEGSTDTAVFTSDNANYVLQSNGNGGLRIASAHQHHICGASNCGEEGHDTVEWAMWTSSDSLPTQAGNYYLTTDVTLKDYWLVESNIKLCLNGHTVTGANGQDVASVTSDGNLTITDCQGTGKITHAQDARGGGISNDGSLALWGGSICGNSVSSDGAGVRNGGTFTMAGGSIENNKSIGDGAGVSNRSSGTFVMTGGKITGNAVTGSGSGGGVHNSGTFQIMGDVQITGNAGQNNAASNVFLLGGKSIAAIGEMGAAASVGISLGSYEASPVVVTGLTNTTAADRFFADDGAHTIEADANGDLRLATHKHRVCGENGCDDENHGRVLTWTSISSLDEIAADGNYYLISNVDRSSAWTCQYNVNLCLDGHTITGADGAPAIVVKTGASLTVTDCYKGDDAGKITHAEGATGGAIENNGALTLWGGQITGNSSDYGGAVYNTADATFTMRGGTIAGNSAHWGGGVRNNGTFVMSGGSIANNSADVAGGGVYNAGTFTLAGDVAIDENKVGVVPNNVYLSGENVINVEKGASLSDKAYVGITAEKPASSPTVVTGTTSSAGFAYDDESYQLIANGNGGLKLTSQHIHAVCGKADCGDEGHSNTEWTAWVSGDSLPTTSGNYYLTSDVALSQTWRVEEGVDIQLCLNGCVVTGPSGKDTIAVASGANLSVTDCQEAAGSITHEKGQTGSGVHNSGTFMLWSGSVTGNTAADQGQGGGVYNLGTFNMNGGSVTGNAAATQGGGVWNAKTFNLRGGSVTGNTAGGQGGGVYTSVPSYATSADYTTFTMTGGSITGNNVTGSDAAGGGVYSNSFFYLSGDVEIRGNAQGGTIADGSVGGGAANNVCVNKALNVASAGMGALAEVGITSPKSGEEPIVVEGTTSTSGFFSDSGNHSLVGISTEKALRLKAGHNHAICGQNGCTENHEGIAWTAWDSDNSLPTQAGNYYLTKDVNLSDQWKVGSDIKLCLNGKTVTSSYYGAAILVVHDSDSGTYGNLTITDCGSGDSTGTITHTAGKVGEAINNQNTLTIWGGKITGNSGSVGAGVYNGTDSTFSMYGGSITGNSGAGVYNSGTIVVAGDAKITGNASDGAASNVFLMNNKAIEVATGGKPLSATAKIGITAQSPDLGSNVVNGSTNTGVFTSDSEDYELLEGENSGLKLSRVVNLHAHKICGDDGCADASHDKLLWQPVSALDDITADGNYYLTGDVALLDTWTCSYNVNLCLNGKTVTGPAGKDAVKVVAGASLAIADCHAGDAAGKITHKDGEKGRGVCNSGTLTLWNGSITGNSSDFLGGGVYNDGTFAVRGGSVTGNTAGYGGGVYSAGTIAMVGGSVTGNTGTYRGGGVYNNGAMTMEGGSITGNTAVYYGGGVYDEATLKLSGTVSITGNTAGAGDQGSASNAFLDRGKAVGVKDGATLNGDSRVGVSAMIQSGSPAVVAGSTDTGVFTSDSNGYTLTKDGDSYLRLDAVPADISGVKLLASADGAEMSGDTAKSKVYDGQAVSVDLTGAKASYDVAGATFTGTWQKKSGDGYVAIANNEAPKDAGEYRLVVSYGRAGVVFGTTEVPFTITAKELKVAGLTVAEKTYDGTASASVSRVVLTGVVAGDSVGTLVSRASFADKNAGANKAVTAKVELTGDAAANYTVAADAKGTGSIVPKTLDVYVVTSDKPYDGTTEADVWDVWIDGVVAGESNQVSLDTSRMTAAFADASVGEDKDVVIDGLALTGAGKDNYELPKDVAGEAAITKAAGKASVTLEGWTYGGEANAPVPASTTNGTDGVTYQYKAKGSAGSTYASAVPTAAGDYTVKATFPSTANYEAATATADFTISPKALTIAGLVVAEKTYDGTTTATIEGAPTLAGVVAGDDVSLVNGTPTFSSKTVGKNIPVSFTAFSLSGKAAANYALAQPAGVTGTIVAKQLTITGATVAEKTYDGTAAATVTSVSFDGLLAGESLAFGTDYTVTGAAYDGVNATGDGAATKVDFSVTLKATSVGRNYVLKDAKGSQAATIKKVETQGYTPVIAGKAGEQGSCQVTIVPGGSVQVSCLDALGIIDGEPTFANGTLTYKLKDSATEGQTAVLRVRVKSANYADYEVLVTVEVAAKEQVDIDLKGDEFTYNGQAQAPAIAVEGNKLEVSDLDVTYYDAMGEKLDAAPSKAGVYLMQVSVPDSNTSYTGFAFCTFQIAAKPLTATLKAQDKTYDGNALATAAVELSGVVDGDKVSADVASAFFADKNVGGEKTVRAEIALLGDDAANYTMAETAEAKASITAKDLGVTAAAADKTYDGRADASATATLDGVVPGDDVTATVTSASFADKNAGRGKDVTVGVALEGADKGNYAAASTVKTTASIVAKQLVITGATVEPKAYDGSTAATVTSVSFDGLLVGESLAFGTDYGVTGAKYDGANATGDGSATKVGFSVTLAGTAAARNYTLVSAAGEQAATIAKAETSGYAISVEGKRGKQGDCWVYVVPGGEASVSVQSDVDGILADAPTFANGTLTYSLKASAAEGQTATVKVKVASANYADYEVLVTIGVTEKVQVEIDLTGEEFTYNGRAQSPAIAVEGNKLKVSDLDVTYYDAAGEELEKAPSNAGTYLMVVAVPDSNTSYTGLAACTFEIARKAVSVKDLSIAPKFYDGTTRATIGSRPAIDGAVEGDDVALVNGVPTFTSAAVGESVPVRFTDFSLTGGAASNYELAQPTGVTGIISAYSAYGFEYRATTVEWTNQDFVVSAADGWKVCLTNTADGDWKDSLTCSDDGAGSLTFYVRNTEFGYISQAVALDYHIDKTAPAGKIEIGKDFWTEFLETVTFGLYRNDKQVVTITGTDALSGVAKVEYLVTAEDLTIDQLAGREFAVYSGAFDIEPDTSAIVYARVTDAAGNVSYLRSDGVVLDATAPVILYVEDGRTYCGAADMKVIEANLDTVTVNGVAVELDEGWLTVGPAEGEQVVVVTDKAGNSATVTFTVNDGHTWGEWVSNGDGTHTRTCKYDALHTQKAYCHGGEATCSDRAVCDDCGQEYGEVDPGTHAALTHVAAKEATTSAEGNIEYWYCEACGKYFADEAGEQEISWADIVVPKKDEDKKDDSDDKDDDSTDDSTDDAKPASKNADKKSPAKPEVPETGDATAAALAPALLGGAAISAVLFSSRKKRRE